MTVWNNYRVGFSNIFTVSIIMSTRLYVYFWSCCLTVTLTGYWCDCATRRQPFCPREGHVFFGKCKCFVWGYLSEDSRYLILRERVFVRKLSNNFPDPQKCVIPMSDYKFLFRITRFEEHSEEKKCPESSTAWIHSGNRNV